MRCASVGMFRWLLLFASLAGFLPVFGAGFDFGSRFGLELLDPVDVKTCTASNAVPVEGSGRTSLRMTPWGKLVPFQADVGVDENILLGVSAGSDKMSLGEAEVLFGEIAGELSGCTNLVRRAHGLRGRSAVLRSALWVGTAEQGAPVGLALDLCREGYGERVHHRVRLQAGLLDRVLYLGTCLHPYLGEYPAGIGEDVRGRSDLLSGPMTGAVTRVDLARRGAMRPRGRDGLVPTALLVDAATGRVCGHEARFWHTEAEDAAARRGDVSRLARALDFRYMLGTNDVEVVAGDGSTTITRGYIDTDGHDAHVEIVIPERPAVPPRSRRFPAVVRVVDEMPGGESLRSDGMRDALKPVLERNRRLRAEHAGRMKAQGAFRGAWGVSQEFNITILHFDPCGKGVFMGFMSMIVFSWTHDGDGTITCTLEEPVELLKDQVGKAFRVRYHPDGNTMEFLPGGPFGKDGDALPGKKLPFMSAESCVQQILKRLEEDRAKEARQVDAYWKDKVRTVVTNRFESLEAVLGKLEDGRKCLGLSLSVQTGVPELADVFSWQAEGGPFIRVYLTVAQSEKGTLPANVPPSRLVYQWPPERPADMPEPKHVCRTGVEDVRARCKEAGLTDCGDQCQVAQYGSWTRCRERVTVSWKPDSVKAADVCRALAPRFAGRFPCDVVVTTVVRKP